MDHTQPGLPMNPFSPPKGSTNEKNIIYIYINWVHYSMATFGYIHVYVTNMGVAKGGSLSIQSSIHIYGLWPFGTYGKYDKKEVTKGYLWLVNSWMDEVKTK